MTPRGPLYHALDRVMLRAPVLSVEDYAALVADPHRGLADPLVRVALAVGSPDLLAQVDRDDASPRRAARTRSKLQRYLIRMSTRPTPYGVFAGAALAELGDSTDLRLDESGPQTRTRPDMGWLAAFVARLEAVPEIRHELRVLANPSALVGMARASLREPAPVHGTEPRPVTVRATPVVRAALELARTPIAWTDLAEALGQRFDAAAEDVERLLDELWGLTFLLTELRPPLTVGSPGRYVADRLADRPAARGEHVALVRLLDAMRDWDQLALPERPDAGTQIERQAAAMVPGVDGPRVQVDTVLPLSGRTLTAEVGRAAARAADLLLRLGVHRDPDPLGAYRQRFLERYGSDREVGLLELLDPEVGLGPPSANPRHEHGPAQARRQAVLRSIVMDALRLHQAVVDLDRDQLSSLAEAQLDPETAPLSLDLSVFVLATSAADVDAGRFEVLVGPNLGAQAAGRNLGRFASLLGTDAEKVLREAAQRQLDIGHGGLVAELVYLPRNSRSANVAVRPSVYPREVAVDTTPSVDRAHSLRVDELLVGLRDGLFYIRTPGLAGDVSVHASHMLNSRSAPVVCRFLEDVSRGRRRAFAPFSWGSMTEAPYLPRLQAQGVILSPAQWRIDGPLRDRILLPDDASFAARLAAWRQIWGVPSLAYVAQGDNRLLIDLDSTDEVDQLRRELRRARGPVVLHEPLPGPEHAWLPGPRGHHVCEVVVSLVQPAPRNPGVRARVGPAPRHVRVAEGERLRTPGSDWLYLKLYGPAAGEDDLLTGPVDELARLAVHGGLASHWFFVRYGDPDRHLRVRFCGDPDRLLRELLPAATDLMNELVAAGSCSRFEIASYERELERYGGVEGMALAEQVFHVDSDAVVKLVGLRSQAQSGIDPTTLAVASVDSLLATLGMNVTRRLEWCRHRVPDVRASGSSYRTHSAELRSWLGEPASTPGTDLTEVLRLRRAAAAPVAAKWCELDQAGQLARPYDRICDSLVHMHLNRLLGPDGPPEELVLGLLRRVREGLAEAPVGR